MTPTPNTNIPHQKAKPTSGFEPLTPSLRGMFQAVRHTTNRTHLIFGKRNLMGEGYTTPRPLQPRTPIRLP